MKLLWFLLGLALGLVLLGWYRTRLRVKLKRLLQLFPGASSRTASGFELLQLTSAIQQQQQSSQQLKQQLENWQHILQVAPIGFLQVDEENQLCWINAQACELLGIDLHIQGIRNRPLLLKLVRSYELDRLIGEARSTEKLCQKDWILHAKRDDSLNLSWNHPLRGQAFPLQGGYVGVFLENRQEALTLTQERDRWASDVAHELKTPLTSIRLVAETLQARLDTPLRTWVDRLLKETIRLSNLVQDLLDLAQVNLPKNLRLKSTNLPELIKAAWLNLEPLAIKKQLRLDYRGPERLLIQAEEARLYRVLLNLLDNGIKYSPSQQAIQVQVSILPPPGVKQQTDSPPRGIELLQLEVIDAGPGFPEQALPHVFERFYRADPARSRSLVVEPCPDLKRGILPETPHPSISREQPTPNLASGAEVAQISRPSSGSGLGLAIVQQIVEAHGGSVRAANHPETGGAWLQIFLPLKLP